MSLTPPQNEIEPLSEITSCQCLQGGKILGKCGTAGEKKLDLCLNKHSAKLGYHCTSNSFHCVNVPYTDIVE